MSSEPRPGAVLQIWRSGVLQRSALDLWCLLGCLVVGRGIAYVSVPATWIFAGAVMVIAGLLVAKAKTAAPAPRRPGGDE